MSGEICVVAEVVRGELTEQTFVSLAAGRTTVLQGGIHLVIFLAFLTISAIP
jgi:hypothetical protein